MMDFFISLAQYRQNEQKQRRVTFEKVRAGGIDASGVEYENALFTGCKFSGTDLSGASFQQAEFTDCDLSNALLADSFWENCRLIRCRLVGADLKNALLRGVTLQDCKGTDCCMDGASLKDVTATACDFTGASLREVRWKNFRIHDCVFRTNNFFKSSLAGLDFSDCILESPTVSTPPTELMGVRVSAAQAVDLIQLFGVIIAESS